MKRMTAQWGIILINYQDKPQPSSLWISYPQLKRKKENYLLPNRNNDDKWNHYEDMTGIYIKGELPPVRIRTSRWLKKKLQRQWLVKTDERRGLSYRLPDRRGLTDFLQPISFIDNSAREENKARASRLFMESASSRQESKSRRSSQSRWLHDITITTWGKVDHENHGEWFLYTDSGGHDLSVNKRIPRKATFPPNHQPNKEGVIYVVTCLAHHGRLNTVIHVNTHRHQLQARSFSTPKQSIPLLVISPAIYFSSSQPRKCQRHMTRSTSSPTILRHNASSLRHHQRHPESKNMKLSQRLARRQQDIKELPMTSDLPTSIIRLRPLQRKISTSLQTRKFVRR